MWLSRSRFEPVSSSRTSVRREIIPLQDMLPFTPPSQPRKKGQVRELMYPNGHPSLGLLFAGRQVWRGVEVAGRASDGMEGDRAGRRREGVLLPVWLDLWDLTFMSCRKRDLEECLAGLKNLTCSIAKISEHRRAYSFSWVKWKYGSSESRSQMNAS